MIKLLEKDKTVFGSSTIKRTGKIAKGRAKGIARLGNVSTGVKVENTHKQNRATGTN
jgi:hypothetical protein